MGFRIEKCTMLLINKKEKKRTGRIELPRQEGITENNKYLGILEENIINK